MNYYSLHLETRMAQLRRNSMVEDAAPWRGAGAGSGGAGRPRRQDRTVGLGERLVAAIANYGRRLARTASDGCCATSGLTSAGERSTW
jgi:hypothetical protein